MYFAPWIFAPRGHPWDLRIQENSSEGEPIQPSSGGGKYIRQHAAPVYVNQNCETLG